jgi:hypothetical protein
MTQQTHGNKSVALYELYSRITQIAEAMGGTASPYAAVRCIPSAMMAGSHSADVPALHVEMPNSLQVDFAPPYPLNIENALFVQAHCTHGGFCKSDWSFSFGPNGWRGTQAPLSDDEVRACLSPDGPEFAVQ